MCLVLVVDSVRLASSRDKAKREQSKETMFLFRSIVGLCGVLYMAVGPLAVVIGGDIGCNGFPVSPGAVDTSFVPVESVTCALNRTSVFFVMALFNTGLAHMVTTYTLLVAASRMQIARNKIKDYQVARRLVLVALGLPMVLCATMFSLDKLDPSNANYQGQLARWSMWCGPRLTSEQEIAIVYVPFSVTGLLVTAQSIRSWRLLTSLASGVAAAQGDDSAGSMAGPNKALHQLNLKVTALGMSCAVVLVAFVTATAQLVPKFAYSSNQFIDWFQCYYSTRDVPSAFLTTADSCAAIFDITGPKSTAVEDVTIDRPDPVLLGLTFLAETLTVCIFGAFYATFVLKDYRASSNFKKTRSCVHAAPTTGASSSTAVLSKSKSKPK